MNSKNYVVISADGHVGADLLDYKPYLEQRWHEDFDAWAKGFIDPYEERFLSSDVSVNWDSDLRLQQTEADGVAAELLFPNTVPPFYPQNQVFVPLPPQDRGEYERRLAGIRAHNRWLADFCSLAPTRRAGIAQIMVNDIDDAVEDVKASVDAGLRGGILFPLIPPGSHLPPMWSEEYDPIWAACSDLGVPVNTHSGAGLPEYGFDPVGQAMLFTEALWFAHRPLWHLIFGAVFDRFPKLNLILTEQGAGWVPATLATLDGIATRASMDGSPGSFYAGEALSRLKKRPSEYFRSNCFVGASFMHSSEVDLRDEIGLDRIMWGSDFPHSEGTYPYSVEALRAAFVGVPEPEVRQMVGGTAAKVYGFDLDVLQEVADRIGPSPELVATPLVDVPDSFCNAFSMGPTKSA
ncbi:MAG: amidohydrolase family protein [Microthrixaceae bacterium]